MHTSIPVKTTSIFASYAIRLMVLSCLYMPFAAAVFARAEMKADVPESAQPPAVADEALLAGYVRLLPLEAGSNFRDMGGYKTTDGQEVRRGLLFRSGVMTGLTSADQDYLNQFGFKTVVDLRSVEELALFPNDWAHAAGLHTINVDYSIVELFAFVNEPELGRPSQQQIYSEFPYLLKTQFAVLFGQLIEGNVPLVVNCSAGQDRTGLASALILSALGVPRNVIVEDYLLSTKFRRPEVEYANVDFEALAETNAFARLMTRFHQPGMKRKAGPLYTEQKKPFLLFALEQIEDDYGSIEVYLDEVLGVDSDDLRVLRANYLR